MDVPPPSMPTGIMQWIIIIIALIAAIGILYVVIGVTGVAIPSWIITIGWILGVAFVAIFAIKLLMRSA
jgi:hypothetical protein